MEYNLSYLPHTISISDVERDTGLAKETLRVWERRYEFPRPLRDNGGERLYPAEQVVKLRLVKRLLDRGHRPGKIMRQSTDQLRALDAQQVVPSRPVGKRARPAAPVPASAAAPTMASMPEPAPPGLLRAGAAPAALLASAEVHELLALCTTHQIMLLRQRMAAELQRLGMKDFVLQLVAPLTRLVGEAWAAGHLALFEEHLYSEVLQMVLRSAIFAHMQQDGSGSAVPRILLTTLPQERHSLGLLMAEALCASAGAHCISLGTQTPLPDIVAAARTKRADIIALSFSSVMQRRQAIDGLTELRALLPTSVQLWAGGSSAALNKRPPPFVHVLDLDAIGQSVAAWRLRHCPPHGEAR